MSAESQNTFVIVAIVVGLLMLLCVVAVPLLLLFPALGASREAARRAACLNNLKQVGLGFQNMESAIKKFPPSCHVTKDENGKITSMDGWSWCVDVLPYMEQRPLWGTLDTVDGLPLDGNEPHQLALGTIVSEFHCPSFAGWDYVNQATEAEAITNYKAMGGTHLESHNVASLNPTTPRYAPEPTEPKRHPDGGTFPGSTHGVSGFMDGSSCTIIVVETKEQNVARWTVGNETCVVGLPPVVTFATENPFWHPTGYTPRMHFEESTIPVGMRQTYLGWDYDSNPYGDGGVSTPSAAASGPIKYGPSSDHSGVTNHVFADGSVHSIRNSIDPALYMFLITRNNGDPTPDFE